MTAAQEHLDPALRVEALTSLLTERGLVDPATVDNFIKTYEQSLGPMNGAKVVARAWTDPEYGPGCWTTGRRRSRSSATKGPRGSRPLLGERAGSLDRRN
jgi:nitrile hydratase subunit alpha